MQARWLVPLFVVPAMGALSSPPLVSYLTYLAGTSVSGANGIATDAAGFAYISGPLLSPGFPFTLPSLGPNSSSPYSSFVAKLNPSGSQIVWSVGLTVPAGGPIALDGSGFVYVLGGRGDSSTVTKLTPAGDQIVYSTNIPDASATSIAVDAAGNAYITGAAGPALPTTPGAYHTQVTVGNCSSAGAPPVTCNEAFVVQLSPSGAVRYGTYLALAGTGNGIAVDSRGSAWIAGSPLFAGNFVAKLDVAGAALLYSRSFGSGGLSSAVNDAAYGIAVDSEDSAYVVGRTNQFIPTTPGALEPSPPVPGSLVGYVVKFKSSGDLAYGTYVSSGSAILTVAVDAQGRAYLTLSATYAPNDFPCPRATPLVVLSADGSSIVASATNLRAPVSAISVDGKGGVYVAGTTSNPTFLTTPRAFQTQYPGGFDSAYAAKLDLTQPAAPEVACLLNAASFEPGNNPRGPDGSVAPGEIVTLFGHGFVPGAGLRVTFDGIAAPLLFADAAQINAVVPFEAGRTGGVTSVSIQNGTDVIGPVRLPVAAAMPGLFTASGDGRGLAAVLNQDGSVNSNTNRAVRGSVVSVYMTGVGLYKGTLPDGSPAPRFGDGDFGPVSAPFPVPVLGMGATIGGKSAQILYAGQAPGLIAGAVQVNLRIPDDAQPGTAGIVVYVGNYSTGALNPNTLAIR